MTHPSHTNDDKGVPCLVRSRHRLSRDLSTLWAQQLRFPTLSSFPQFTLPLYVRQVLQDHSSLYLVTFTCDVPLNIPHRLRNLLRSPSKTVTADSRLLSTAQVLIPPSYPAAPIRVLSWGSPTLDDGLFRPASSQVNVRPQPASDALGIFTNFKFPSDLKVPLTAPTLGAHRSPLRKPLDTTPHPSKDMRQLLKYAHAAEVEKNAWLEEWGSLRAKLKAEKSAEGRLSQEQRQRRGVRGLFPLVYP